MRWAFWRRRDRDPADGAGDDATQAAAAPPTGAADGSTARTTASPRPTDDSDPSGPAPSPYSGASPQLATSSGAGLPPQLPDLSGIPPVLSAEVRRHVVDLVEAALAGDAPGARQVLRRIQDSGSEEALVAALAPLGERFATLADSTEPEAVLVQGDHVAERAGSRLRAVAPQATRDRVRFVVRFACGVPDVDPALAPQLDAPAAELLLVAGVLLAQTVQDGAGDLDALAAEIGDLLPADGSAESRRDDGPRG